MFGWGPRFNKEKNNEISKNEFLKNNESSKPEIMKSGFSKSELSKNEKLKNELLQNEMFENELLKKKLLRNEISRSEISKNEAHKHESSMEEFSPTEPSEKPVSKKINFTQLYEPFIHIENDYDPIYEDISVVLKNMDTFDYYNDFNNSPTIESIINTIKNKRVETMGSEFAVEKSGPKQHKILYSGFAGKFYSYKTTKTKLLLCIPVKIFDAIKSGDFFKINYKSCNECEFVYRTPQTAEKNYEPNSTVCHENSPLTENQGNFIELGSNRCVLSLQDFCTNLPTELAGKYICYEFVCGSTNEDNTNKKSESNTTDIFTCLTFLYEHCKNVYYNKYNNHEKNKYKSVISGKYIDYHELLWNEPICRVLDIWNEVNYVLVINRDVFNAVYIAPEHKITSPTLGTFKCNPALSASSVSGNGLEINAQDYLVKFSSKDNNFNESAESRVVYLLAWVSDTIKHRSQEHEKKYSKWLRIDE